MRYWGITALSHDASLAVVEDGEILFAAHSERYSRIKNDPHLHPGLLAAASVHGPPDSVVWYERPWLKKLRHARAGQWAEALAPADIPRRYLRGLRTGFPLPDPQYADHHHSHAAASFAGSRYERAAVVVADAIGEFRTFTIGRMETPGDLQVLHQRSYPDSLGLLYSAFTRRCGFRPNEDEYIVMGMAAFGEARHVDAILEELLELTPPTFRLRRNVHRGIGDWLPDARVEDLAASVQAVVEMVMVAAATWAHRVTGLPNLVLSGGVALNCVANSRVAAEAGFDKVWIFPNPGDAGSAVGCVAAATGTALNWKGPYLGTEIAGEYPVDRLLDELLRSGIAAVANGRAEFGPRALGNRSLLADPRPADMKDRVNKVKGREMFRPFAPVIRIERAHEAFALPVAASPYMQFTASCRQPEDFPAIVHVDGTSRVQTVEEHEHPGLYELLARWEERTGCPMLLNTSLNSRGEPLVDTADDAERFSIRDGVPVY